MHISLDSALGRQRRLNSVGESVFQIAPNAAAGYSLRSLTGGDPAVVRVRRESDNAERDFNASGVSSGELVNWVNQQITPPLDLRELTATGRDGPIIDAAAAYSLRNLSDSYTGNVVEVRRNTDGALKDFKASEVTDGTLEAWVNTSFANALPLDTASGAAAAYSLRNLSTGYTGNVVDVRRSSDDAEDSFTAAEVADGTLTDWVNTDVNLYTSDFSVSTNGWNGSGATLTFGESIGGESDALKLEGTTGTIGQMINGALRSEGQSVTIDFDIFFPSSNTGDGGVRIIDNTATIYEDFQSQPTDTWISLSSSFTKSDSTTRTIFRGLDGSSPSLPLGDIFYIKNIVFTQTTADGFVSQWYDQSGNGNHATQGTYASQPKIVDAGVLVAGGLDFDGVDDFFEANGVASSLSGTDKPLSSFMVVSSDVAATTQFILSCGLSSSSSPIKNTLFHSGNTTGFQVRDNAGILNADLAAAPYSPLATYLISNTSDGLVVDYAQDGSVTVNNFDVDVGPLTIDTVKIGARANASSGPLDGKIAEMVIYPSDQSGKRRAIEENIGSNYGITVTSSKDGTVSTWYDQSTTAGTPNANHAVQTDAASQPKIVDAGSLVTGGLDFDGVGDKLDLSGSGLDIFKDVGYGQVFTVITPERTSPGSLRYFEAVSGATGARFLLGDSQDYASSSRIGGRRLDSDSFQDIESSTSHGNNETLITGFLNWTDSDAYLYFNGTQVASSTSFQTDGNTSNTSSASAAIGGVNPGNFKMQELIIYNTDQTDNRTALEANIGEVYSIAGIPAYDDTVNGFVETWYDQSGNDNDATQLTASNQPKIIDAGVLVTDRDGKVALNGKGATLRPPENAPMLSSDGTYSLFAVVDFDDQRNGNEAFNNIIGFISKTDGGASSVRKPLIYTGQDNGEVRLTSPSNPSGTASLTSLETVGVQLLTNIANPALSTGNNTAYVGGVLVSSVNSNTDVNTEILTSTESRLFDLQETTVETFLSEVIYYPSDQSANRAAIEANIILQYDI